MRGTRLAVLLIGFAAFSTLGGAITSYDIALDGRSAAVNVTFEVYVDQRPGGTNLSFSWPLQERAVLEHISDSDGSISNVEREGGRITFNTIIEGGKEKEVITLRYRVPDIVDATYNGVKRIDLRLSAFQDNRPEVPDEVTQVVIRSDERILSETHSSTLLGYDFDLEPNRVTYDGEGPLNVHLAVGDGGTRYDHFTLFGVGNLSAADAMFGVVPAVLGFYPEANTYPVITLPSDEYDQVVDQWSAGQYRTGGIIFLRRSAMEDGDEDISPILMHELVHAFNTHAQRWSTAPSAWFDEGTAKYVEFLVNQQRGVKQAEIFGEAVEWTAPCNGGPGQCRYTLPSRMESDTLWDYYQDGSDFMERWQPADGTNRVFGYAFSELLIRNYIRNRNATALRTVYEQLRGLEDERGEAVTRPREHTRIILEAMGTDFSPCKFPSHSRFEQCLDAVNAMEPAVPEPPAVGNRTEKIVIREIEQPKAATPAETLEGLQDVTAEALNEENVVGILKQIGNWVIAVVERLLRAVGQYR